MTRTKSGQLDGQTDGQGDSSIPPPKLHLMGGGGGGGKTNSVPGCHVTESRLMKSKDYYIMYKFHQRAKTQ